MDSVRLDPKMDEFLQDTEYLCSSTDETKSFRFYGHNITISGGVETNYCDLSENR